MVPTRRDFLKLSVAGSLAGAGVGSTVSNLFAEPVAKPTRAKRILILGGTSFIGPYQVTYALERGHEVTLFNRGRTNPGMFPGVENLIGDRAGDLTALEGRSWDVVIDNSATNPEWVHDSAQLLKNSAEQYVFISTRSVYADLSTVPMTANAPVFTYENTGVEPGGRLPYGLSKALAEKEAQSAFVDRTTIIRPGLIIGPGDQTDRFSYWPIRIDRGGEVMCPGDGTDPVQIIDARDLSEWVIRMVEDSHYGVFNAVGPRNSRSMAELLYGIAAVTTADVTWTWVDADFLIEHGVRPYGEMPVWRPARGNYAGFARFDLSPEIERGLTFRPLAVTAADTLEYHYSRPEERRANLRAGISPEREAEVLALWHDQNR